MAAKNLFLVNITDLKGSTWSEFWKTTVLHICDSRLKEVKGFLKKSGIKQDLSVSLTDLTRYFKDDAPQDDVTLFTICFEIRIISP